MIKLNDLFYKNTDMQEKLKNDIRAQKKKRAENEALERAEEADRKLKKKKEEEEFMRLPDET